MNLQPGERIKKLRLEKRLTQEELGDLIGVKKATIQKYESGIIINFKKDIIEKLSEILGTTPATLMGWNKFDELINTGNLTKEVYLIEQVQAVFGIDLTFSIQVVTNLNATGRAKVLNYASDMMKIAEYNNK